MPEKKAPPSGKLIRGDNADTNIVANQNPVVNIPLSVIKRLEGEIRGVDFGGVSLIVAIRDGHPTFRIEKTISIIPGRQRVADAP